MEHDINKQKYALINLRKIEGEPKTPQELAAAILKHPESVEFGEIGTENEFFVVKLKDVYSRRTLLTYAQEVHIDGNTELGIKVDRLACRAGINHPNCKKPD